MVNKSTTVSRFVVHTLQRNITYLAVITRKTNIKLGILKGGGGGWKRVPVSLGILTSPCNVVRTVNLGFLVEGTSRHHHHSISRSVDCVIHDHSALVYHIGSDGDRVLSLLQFV